MTGILLLIFLLLIILVIAGYAFFTTKNAKKNNSETWLMKWWAKPSIKAIAASLISIFAGLIIGCFILIILAGKKIGGVDISLKTGWEGFQLIFFGVLNIGRNSSGNLIYGFNGVNIGNMLFNATPLILTGLSVALAFKTGLFNIGTPGQYLMGTAATLIVALSIPNTALPSWIIWILAFISGVLAGALWGVIPGFFKAYLNVNEVITCIMTNWIAANLVTSFFDKTTGLFRSLLDPDATKNLAYVFKTSHNGVSTAKFGLDKIFAGSQVNGGILIAILIAVVVFIVLNKTTFGYELKACGANKNASKYAGINEKRNIILSMAIAGGLAAAGASLYYLAGNTEFAWETYQSLPGVAFNGIPVALLATNNPISVIFTSIFMAFLDVNGMQIKYMTTYNEYITSIISAIIVYFSAFSLVISSILYGKNKKKKELIKKNDEIKLSTSEDITQLNNEKECEK